MANDIVIFRLHAVQRMLLRDISREDVHKALQTGEVIETYPKDRPYPSRLLLSWSGARPIYVVVADNLEEGTVIIITVYEPDLAGWQVGYRRRAS